MAGFVLLLKTNPRLPGFPISGFQVDAIDQVVLNLKDDARSWTPGDRVVVASTDYSMYQAEEFTLLPCPKCNQNQVRIQGWATALYLSFLFVWRRCSSSVIPPFKDHSCCSLYNELCYLIYLEWSLVFVYFVGSRKDHWERRAGSKKWQS